MTEPNKEFIEQNPDLHWLCWALALNPFIEDEQLTRHLKKRLKNQQHDSETRRRNVRLILHLWQQLVDAGLISVCEKQLLNKPLVGSEPITFIPANNCSPRSSEDLDRLVDAVRTSRPAREDYRTATLYHFERHAAAEVVDIGETQNIRATLYRESSLNESPGHDNYANFEIDIWPPYGPRTNQFNLTEVYFHICHGQSNPDNPRPEFGWEWGWPSDTNVRISHGPVEECILFRRDQKREEIRSVFHNILPVHIW